MPPVMPIDLNAVLGIVFGCLIVLIPVAGITARFTIKPITEAIARAREADSRDRDVAILEKRVALLEQQVQSYEGSLERLIEEREFDRKLGAPQG